MNNEKQISARSGYGALVILFLLIGAGITLIVLTKILWMGLLLMVISFLTIMVGFFVVNPNNSRVMTLFGEYKGTVKDNGFFWINPFYKKQKISLRARNFDSEKLKVNDKIGNPILISVILVWRVKDTYKAAFDVNDYEQFVKVQTDAAVRKLAGMYPYDNFAEDQLSMESNITLRSGLDEVNEALEHEIAERLSIAGIEVMESRIGYLAYAPEIANAMLKRQQAVAVVAARKKIVEGAVGMVEDALVKLSQHDVVEFDEDKKASMVSNLMVVLCSDKEAMPVINAGTLNS